MKKNETTYAYVLSNARGHTQNLQDNKGKCKKTSHNKTAKQSSEHRALRPSHTWLEPAKD